MMKSLVDDSELWEGDVRGVVVRTFDVVSGGDSSLDTVELEKWLNKGWVDQRRRRSQVMDAPVTPGPVSEMHATPLKQADTCAAAVASAVTPTSALGSRPRRLSLHSPTSVRVHPLRPHRFVRSESGGCCSSSTASPSRPSKDDGTPSWMRPATLRGAPPTTTLIYKRDTLKRPSPPQLSTSRSAPQLPSPSRSRSAIALHPSLPSRHKPTRPVVGWLALHSNAANDAQMAEAAAAHIAAKRALALGLRGLGHGHGQLAAASGLAWGGG